VKTILFLAIPPGTTGSPFDERVISKIKALRVKYNGSILIDGGINPETYTRVLAAGASEAGGNSAWWRGDFNGEA
jgi:pentose-5-phosphate-3-epimerase